MSPWLGSSSAQRRTNRSATPNTGLGPSLTSTSLPAATADPHSGCHAARLGGGRRSSNQQEMHRPDASSKPTVADPDGGAAQRRSFRWSFHPALLGPTGAYWLDDPSDLTCKDGTGQHAVDDPRLS